MLFKMPQLLVLPIQLVISILYRLLRFLNDGTYVQIAVLANGYCASTLSAFSIAE